MSTPTTAAREAVLAIHRRMTAALNAARDAALEELMPRATATTTSPSQTTAPADPGECAGCDPSGALCTGHPPARPQSGGPGLAEPAQHAANMLQHVALGLMLDGKFEAAQVLEAQAGRLRSAIAAEEGRTKLRRQADHDAKEALRDALAEVPHRHDASTCECSAWQKGHTCWHVRAQRVLEALAEPGAAK